MERRIILEAAAMLKVLQDAKALRATLHGGKHELRLYAIGAEETMEDEVAVGGAIAEVVLADLVAELESRLTGMGVAR